MANDIAYGTLQGWVHRTSSWFALWPMPRAARAEPKEPSRGLVYRLRQWPDLHDSHRTAAIYRSLSVMSHRRVNHAWLLRHSRMKPVQFARFLQELVEQGAIEVVDVSAYPEARQ